MGLAVHLSDQAALAFGHAGVLTMVNPAIQLRVPTLAPCIRGCVCRIGMVRIASSWIHGRSADARGARLGALIHVFWPGVSARV